MPQTVKPPIVEAKQASIVQTSKSESEAEKSPRQAIKPSKDSSLSKENVAINLSKPETETDGIGIGTKLSIRYLNGPRAGFVAKFWFQKTTNDPKFEVNGYKSVGTDSPLGEALDGAKVNEIVIFSVRDDEIRVQIIEMHHAKN